MCLTEIRENVIAPLLLGDNYIPPQFLVCFIWSHLEELLLKAEEVVHDFLILGDLNIVDCDWPDLE